MTNHTAIYITHASYTAFAAALLMIHLAVGAILTPSTARHRGAQAHGKARR
jgi:hypothetical protein